MKNTKPLSLGAVALVAILAFAHSGPYSALIVAFVLLALLSSPARPEFLCVNTIDANLNLTAILEQGIMAFKRVILPLTMFASTFRNVQLRGNDTITVPYYPLDASASKDFVQATGYVFDEDTNTASRQINVNKRKYKSLVMSSRDLARIPLLDAEKLGRLKGEKLAYDVINDILSIVTAANYGASIFTGVAGGFDSDDVVDIRTAIGKAHWPLTGRGLMVNLDYDAALLKDSSFKAAYALGTDRAVRTGLLPNIFGFDYAASDGVPANGENLVGFAAYMSAILVAFSPIEPAPDVMKVLTDYRIVTDPDTGISFEYRQWGDADFDLSKRVIECNYGFAKGEAAALKRIVSA